MCALTLHNTLQLQRDFPLGSTIRIVEAGSRWAQCEGRIFHYFHDEAAQGCLAAYGLVISFDRGKTVYNYSEAYARDKQRMILVRKGPGRL